MSLSIADFQKISNGSHNAAFMANNPKAGTAQYSYQIKVAGLGSGNPYIASVGFGQSIEAENMQ